MRELTVEERARLAARNTLLNVQNRMMPLDVGTKVTKPKGYPYPGTVVAAFTTLAGELRYVVESELAPGMLHIFSGTQLERA